MKKNGNQITIAFCEAIFKACPWVAPQSWHDREAVKKAFADTIFEAAGFDPKNPFPGTR